MCMALSVRRGRILIILTVTWTSLGRLEFLSTSHPWRSLSSHRLLRGYLVLGFDVTLYCVAILSQRYIVVDAIRTPWLFKASVSGHRATKFNVVLVGINLNVHFRLPLGYTLLGNKSAWLNFLVCYFHCCSSHVYLIHFNLWFPWIKINLP